MKSLDNLSLADFIHLQKFKVELVSSQIESKVNVRLCMKCSENLFHCFIYNIFLSALDCLLCSYDFIYLLFLKHEYSSLTRSRIRMKFNSLNTKCSCFVVKVYFMENQKKKSISSLKKSFYAVLNSLKISSNPLSSSSTERRKPSK